jgi:hypothetical protein
LTKEEEKKKKELEKKRKTWGKSLTKGEMGKYFNVKNDANEIRKTCSKRKIVK